ncbi:hypothetical protein [Georgenia satyanarayanai]|uniref:hypothetical protein n=1 Tax=Georgenia satyanarayanai TaxID=860221 RepID=UPI00186B4982|nr:hypothetical protein [Georgenia satyanarayanai]
MSDNPYERDNPDEPVEPVAAPTDSEATTGTPSDPPWSQRLDPAPPADDAPWLADDDGARSAHDATGPVTPTTDDDGARPADDTPAAAPGEPALPSDDVTRPVPLVQSGDEAGTRASARGETTPAGDADRTQVLRTHQAERPVPRSGLAEHRSAAYLTGERPVEQEPRPEPESTPTATTPAPWLTGAGAAAATAAPAPVTREDSPAEEEHARRDREVLLEGTTAHTRPPSRAKAHVLTIVVTLLLTPVAWYLLADAGARLTLPPGNPWETANLNVAALLELAGGLLVLVLVLLAARWSSVGAIVTGALVVVVGVPFVAVPAWTQDLLEPVESWLAGLGDFGDNVAHHLVASGSTGRLVAVGVALVLVGVVSHGARRQGRREVRPAVEA